MFGWIEATIKWNIYSPMTDEWEKWEEISTKSNKKCTYDVNGYVKGKRNTKIFDKTVKGRFHFFFFLLLHTYFSCPHTEVHIQAHFKRFRNLPVCQFSFLLSFLFFFILLWPSVSSFQNWSDLSIYSALELINFVSKIFLFTPLSHGDALLYTKNLQISIIFLLFRTIPHTTWMIHTFSLLILIEPNEWRC